MQSGKVDNSKIITDNYKLEKENAKQQHLTEVARLKNEIEIIKNNPNGWGSGKRKYLTQKQLTQIENYNKEIISLNNTYTNTIQNIENKVFADMQKNNLNTAKEGNHFWYVGIIIMIAQILFNLLLQTFAEGNYYELNTNEYNQQLIEKFESEKKRQQEQILINFWKKNYINLTNAMQIASADVNTIPMQSINFNNITDIQKNNNLEVKKELINDKQESKIGFKKEEEQKNESEIPEQIKYNYTLNNSENNKSKIYEVSTYLKNNNIFESLSEKDKDFLDNNKLIVKQLVERADNPSLHSIKSIAVNNNCSPSHVHNVKRILQHDKII